jgi:hypothetical protein
MEKVAKDLKSYFTRCNECNFYLQDCATIADDATSDNLSGIKFHVHAIAYSNIGTGVKFQVDFSKNKVKVLSDDACGAFDDHEEVNCESDEAELQNADDADEEFDDESDDELEDDPDDDSDREGLEDFVLPPNIRATFTGVEIMKHRVFGIDPTFSNSALNASRSSSAAGIVNIAGDDDNFVFKKDVLGRSLFLANNHLLNNHHFRYSSERQEVEYAKAANFDATPPRQQGFARRPEQGKFYGAKYGAPYVRRVKKMFDEGTKASSSKFSASQMQEVLRQENRDNPFCIPTLHEITTLIQTFMRKSDSTDDDNGEIANPEETVIRPSTYRGKIPLPIVELIFQAMEEYPGKTGVFIEGVVKQRYDGDTSIYDEKEIKARVNAENVKIRKKTLKNKIG